MLSAQDLEKEYRSGPEVVRVAKRLGAIVLEKPLDLDVLEAAVQKLAIATPSPSA